MNIADFIKRVFSWNSPTPKPSGGLEKHETPFGTMIVNPMAGDDELDEMKFKLLLVYGLGWFENMEETEAIELVKDSYEIYADDMDSYIGSNREPEEWEMETIIEKIMEVS